jgi:hypothetical protein
MQGNNATQRPRAIGIATAAMCALAGGAIWCLLALYSHGDLSWFAFVVAGLVVWALRAHGYAGRWSGALIAALCVILASGYALYLQTVARVASMFDLPMRTALLRMDFSMGIDIARSNLSTASLVMLAFAVLLAGASMLHTRRLPPQ